MPLLDIQRKGQQIGRIRIGVLVQPEKGKPYPRKIDTFRFTTGSRPTAGAIAEHFGGEVREWRDEWEVITRESAIPVTVPPRDRVVSQDYEMWSKGGCQRRCDSVTEQISNGPCLCPADQLQRAEWAKANPPRACKPVTRINVMIPDLPGLGVFRLDTGSYYAAVEIGDAAALMELARDRGVFLPAILRIDQRSRVANGQTKKYPVPVLEVLATFRQIASGELEAGGITAQLPPAPGEAPKAITSGTAPARPAVPAQAPAPEAEGNGPLADDGEDAKQRRAQEIADELAGDIDPPTFRARVWEAEDKGLTDQFVCIDRAADEWQELGARIEDRRAELRQAGTGRPRPAAPAGGES
jgi:hypothetical protein